MEYNPVGWFEIYVQDMKRARQFYETVLQLKLDLLDSPLEGVELYSFPMVMDKRGASGALVKMADFASGGNSTLVYFSCADCGEEASRVKDAGGQLIREKFSIAQYGFIALATDTEGNMIGFHSMT